MGLLKKSVIISGAAAILGYIKELYSGSFFYYCYSRLGKLLDRLLGRSFIVNIFRKNWDKGVLAERSAINGNIGRILPQTEFGAGGEIAAALGESLFISYLNIDFVRFLVYLAIFALPFLPTMLLAMLSAAAFLIYLANILMGREKISAPGLMDWAVILFGLCYVISCLLSYNFPQSGQVALIFIAFMVMFFVVRGVLDNEKRLGAALNIFLFSALLVGLYGIYQYLSGIAMDAAWIDEKTFSQITTRAYSTFNNPNVLGEYLVVAISLGFGMLWSQKGFFRKVYYIIVTGILLIALACTGSRGAMLGVIISAAFFIILAEKRLLILGAAALAAMPFFLPDTIWARIASVVTLTDTSSLYRISIYKASVKIIEEYWLSGIGVGAFPLIYPEFSFTAAYAYHSHNLFLQEFIELGILGFSIFISLLLLFFQKLYYGIKKSAKTFGFLSAAFFGAFAGLVFQGMTDNIWHDYSIILLFWMLMGLGLAAVKTGVNKNGPNKSDSCYNR